MTYLLTGFYYLSRAFTFAVLAVAFFIFSPLLVPVWILGFLLQKAGIK